MKKTIWTMGIVYAFITVFAAFFILKSWIGGERVKHGYYELNLTDSFTWGLVDKEDYPSEAEIESKIIYPIKFGKRNLEKITGRSSHYIWLKTTFTLPEELKGKDLGVYFTYIHFADKVWINDQLVGYSGSFPPFETTPMYLAHGYNFPSSVLHQEGENTLLVQVFCHGKSEISGQAFISEQHHVNYKRIIKSFFNTYAYMFFAGSMLAAMFIFSFLFFMLKNRMEYLWYALLCLCAMVFSSSFYIPVCPLYIRLGIPYYKFYRTIMCFTGILNFVLFVAFVRQLITLPKNFILELIRLVVFIVQLFMLLSTRNYDELMRISIPELCLTFFHMLIVAWYIIRGFQIEMFRKSSLILTVSLLPFVIMLSIDLIIRMGFKITTLPYFSFYGWQLTIISYLVVLSHNHAMTIINNEYLNTNLKEEVQKQTENLHQANNRLLDRIHRSNIDLQMAAVVQQKFFPYPKKNYQGWDLAVNYEPLSEVSGDFFDYYALGIKLDGISLFDVSGHGIAASLITMLSKNIVYNAFQKNRFYDVPISKCLLDVNHDLIVAKGTIDNYMTGIMMRIGNFDENDCCKIDFANAGHPRPILYRAATDDCIEIIGDSEAEQFGAIGMANIDVKYRDVSFTMQKDDILVCYTDGVTEAENLAHEQFGKQRIMDFLMENHTKNAHRLVSELARTVKMYVGEADRKDDITIIVMKREDSKDFLEALDAD